nr:sugar ABC transporter permease [Coprococcus comes]
MVFGLVLAFLLNQKKLRGSNFFKTVFYFPNLVTAVSLGVLFSLLFDWKAGSVNQVLMTLHIIKDPINWKGSPLLSQLIVALVLFWQYFGYYTIIFTAGIRGIPYELFEAAEVDGASKVQTFFKIVLPLMRPIMTFAFVTSIIGGLQIFDLPYTFGGAMGGTKASLLTMVMYMYNIAFTNLDYGYGAAISYGLFVIIIVFSIIFMKYTTGKKEQY